MSVGSWEPGQSNELSASVVSELLAAAARLDEPEFGLDADQIGRLAGVARDADNRWQTAAESLEAAELLLLVQLFTLAERRLPSWEAGAKSPVIAIARTLKMRGAWPDDLTAWIKANSDNRFLPHGSLLDRL